MPRSLALAVGAATLIGLAGCGDPKPAAGDGKIAVEATDTACKVAKTELPAGVSTFVITNKGSKVTEFYVYAGEAVKGEQENIAPGLSRELRVDLKAGAYEAACKPGQTGDGIRVRLTVTGEGKQDDAKVGAAVATYKAYVVKEAADLVPATRQFVDAVKAGDRDKAKALYAPSRLHYERIEPVAESFGDFDPAIDARENNVEAGKEWTGYHRLEKDLWGTADLASDAKLADQLLADVTALADKVKQVELSATDVANGAKELLDEVATTKITGEEDRYSHTDLWDFEGNVAGSKAVVDALRPVLTERDAALLGTLDDKFAAAGVELAKHKVGDGYKLHNQLSPAELKALSDAINALAEPISKVAAVVAR